MRRWLAMLCFFMSGAAGLIDEIVWIKRSALVFGSTTLALSTVLAVFFGGLAIGSEIFGRIGRRLARPVRVYALLELSLAVLALLSLPAFALIDTLYGHLYRFLADGSAVAAGGAPLLIAARVGLVVLVLLPPAVAMGGTLPLFVRQFAVSRDALSTQVGFLYGVNTLGAAVGTLAAGFWLLPRIGLQGSIAVAAALNVAAGLLALRLRLRAGAAEAADEYEAGERRGGKRLRIVASLFFLTGMTALAAEVVWSRFLSLMIRNTVTTYTLTLAVVLVGIVIGSWVAARLWDRRWPLAPVFAALQAASGLIVLLLTGLSSSFWMGLGQGIAPYAVLMLPPAILSGASFPLAVRLAGSGLSDSTRIVGRLTALNTSGGIVGSLLAGFWLVPRFGVAWALKTVVGLSILASVVALILLDRPAARRLVGRAVFAACIVAAWVLLPTLTPATLPHDYLARSGHILDVAEGYGSTLAVVRRDGELQLLIDRLWQGADRKNHQIVAAHLPALLHPHPSDVLVIGLGVGQTASRFLMHDVATLDCVDIEPAIFPFVRRHFDSGWMDDPRVRLIPDDGRSYVSHTSRTYDIVSIEVGQVFRPGVDAFYTREFYRQVRERLAPGGLIAQFVPLSFMTEVEFRRILATFLEICPGSTLWYNDTELLLIGTPAGSIELPPERLLRVRDDPRLASDLAWSHWGGQPYYLNQPDRFLAGFLCGSRDLAILADGADVYVDAIPELAYATSRLGHRNDGFDALVDLIAARLSPPGELWPDGRSVPAWDESATEIRRRHLSDLKVRHRLAAVRENMATAGSSRSIQAVEAALQLNPESVQARRMLGDLLNLAGRQDEALVQFQRVQSRAPDDVLVLRGLALSLCQTGRLAEAERHLRRVLEAVPDDALAHNYLGACLADRGRIQEAIGHFREAVRLDPADANAVANLRQAETMLMR